VLTQSEFARALLRTHYDVDAVAVGGGVDTAVFAPNPEATADYVLSVGEITPRKGYPFLISALSRVPLPRRPRLVIAANARHEAEAAAVERQAAALGVTLQSVCTADDAALAALYAGARAFVYAPYDEMLGLAALEAMSCGVPVVAVRDGGVAETILDGVTGWLTARDPAHFAARLEALLADEVLRRRMGAAAAEHVRATWTWPRTVDRIETVLREVAHRT
jgi:glycosyltransferase involved in cell wall biosynthesis